MRSIWTRPSLTLYLLVLSDTTNANVLPNSIATTQNTLATSCTSSARVWWRFAALISSVPFPRLSLSGFKEGHPTETGSCHPIPKGHPLFPHSLAHKEPEEVKLSPTWGAPAFTDKSGREKRASESSRVAGCRALGKFVL